MKKVLGIILAVVVSAVLIFCLWYFTPLSAVSVERVLPPRPVVYIRVTDAVAYWERLQQSQFGLEMSRIKLDSAARDNNWMNVLIHTARVLQDQTNTPEIREYVNKFMGKEITLAMYPADSESGWPVPGVDSGEKKGFPEIFWVSRIPADIKFKELLLRIYPREELSAEAGLDKISYQGHVIFLLPAGNTGLTIAFTRIGDLVVAALDEKVIRQSIDISGNVRPSLSGDKSFRVSLKEISPKDAILSVYWDTTELLAMLTHWMDGKRAPDPAMNEAFGQLKDWKAGSLSVSLDDGVRIRNRIYFDRESASGDFGEYLKECHPGENQSLFLTPKDVLLYQSVGCLNFSRYWRQVKDEVTRIQKHEEENASSDAVQKFQTMLGVNIENDLLPVLGNEIGWFANPGVQPVPLIGIKLPQAAVFIKINDAVKARQLMMILLAKTSLQMKREIMSGVEVLYMETPLGTAVEPGFILFGDYLIVGLNRDILKESIYAAYDKRVSLFSGSSFQEVVKLADGKDVIGVFYFKLGEVLENYENLIESGFKWAAGRNPDAAADQKEAAAPVVDQADVVWRDVLGPVVQALKHVRALGVEAQVLEDHFSTDVLIRMDQ